MVDRPSENLTRGRKPELHLRSLCYRGALERLTSFKQAFRIKLSRQRGTEQRDQGHSVSQKHSITVALEDLKFNVGLMWIS